MKLIGDCLRHMVMVASIWLATIIIILICFSLLVDYGLVETKTVFTDWLVADRSNLFFAMFVFLYVIVRIFIYELFKSDEADKKGNR